MCIKLLAIRPFILSKTLRLLKSCCLLKQVTNPKWWDTSQLWHKVRAERCWCFGMQMVFPSHEHACFLLEVPIILLKMGVRERKRILLHGLKVFGNYFSVFLPSCLHRFIILSTCPMLSQPASTNNVVNCSAFQVVN